MDNRAPITGPYAGPPLPPWWLVLGWAAVLAAVSWAGWRSGMFQGQSPHNLYFLLLGALINVTLLALFFWFWMRLSGRRERCYNFDQDLRYLRSWAGEEGRLRKQGLIRDINALGAVPADLEAAVLAHADLAGADLHGCNLKGADLRGANLRGAILDGADLWGADLSGAELTMASLRSASLRGVNLEGAELVKARLTGADLHRANLVGTNLHGTDLTRVRLHRTRFAAIEEGSLPGTVHSSVEDWIRERLDEKGCYGSAGNQSAGKDDEAPGSGEETPDGRISNVT